MADNVTKALMLDKIPIDGKALLLVQYNDGSPFLHSLLAHSARQNRKICLVSFNQAPSYYHSIGTRLGWNSHTLQSKGLLTFIGGPQAFKDSLHGSGDNLFAFMLHPTGPSATSPLEMLFSRVKDAVSNCEDQPITIVIDELGSLLNCGVSVKDVVLFYQLCHSLLRSRNNCALVVSVGLTPSDEEAVRFGGLLSHWSDLVLTEKGLQTGRSKDLGGTLFVQWNSPPLAQEQYQFKCFDRGIRMFAPGTCSAVL